uniref:hypothetical protein n=1 Tax=Nonomuraea pusilla TaxID=46177 RepID=UPI0006E14D22|nr:hypothetical protein [Nonomuraea pusilla]
MSLSDVIRNIAKTVTDKDQLKEKAKDLPLFVVQTTLSAAGQALLVVDRIKNSVKGLGKEDREEEQEPAAGAAAAQLAEAEAEEEKPARKEPVIFAPRPKAGAEEDAGQPGPDQAEAEQAKAGQVRAESNGSAPAKPEPVIFKPAKKKTEEKAEEPAPAKQEAKVQEAPVQEAPAQETVAQEAPAQKPAAQVTPVQEPAAQETPAQGEAVLEKAVEPVAEAPAVAEEPAPAAAEEPAPAAEKPGAGEGAPAEPLPGYAGLSVASLRARMRGKDAAQIAALLEYERATQARADIVRMYENRLAKLQAEA